jgi:hypothetical protein
MRVWINEAGENELPCGIDHLRSRRHWQVAADRGDRLVFAPDVADISFAGATISPFLISRGMVLEGGYLSAQILPSHS